jgi:hypothetical protein
MKCKSWAVTGLILIIVFALTACGKSSDSPTYSITGTATMDGNALQGVRITLSGANSAATNTDETGNYTFENLPAGTYTVTPSLAGYNYSPSNPAVTITSANKTQNFNAASAVTSYSISGTISYDGGGRVDVGLKNADGSATGHGTSITSPGPFTIRGVPPGTYYKLTAELDTRVSGTLNADNPSGEILTITVTNANLTGQDITLTWPDPVTPVTPTGLTVNPGDGVALILWNHMRANNKNINGGYKIYWGTDPAATNGTPIYVQESNNSYLQSIPNGTYYYKITAGSTESAPSAVVGPVTIGAGTGLNTVSGKVTIPFTTTKPLYVGLWAGNGIYYFTRIASPTTSQTYSFSGVPNGTYKAFAFLDTNTDNSLGFGDERFDDIGTLPVVINNNNPTVDMTLSGANYRSYVTTEHWMNGSSAGYILNFAVNGMRRLPVKANIAFGHNIPVPLDIQRENNSVDAYYCPVNIGTVRPALADSYRFYINSYDTTVEQMTAPVTAVLDSFVQNLIATDTTTIPTFSWSAPASPPSYYSYYIAVYDTTTGKLVWYYPSNTPFGMPSTQTSVLYNVDGRASQSSLAIGTKYDVYVITMDAYLNSAWYGISDTPTTVGSSGGGAIITNYGGWSVSNSGSITGYGGSSGVYIVDIESLSVSGSMYTSGLTTTVSGSIQIYAH